MICSYSKTLRPRQLKRFPRRITILERNIFVRDLRTVVGDRRWTFVLGRALGGGVTRSLALDAHGKSLSSALMDLEIPEPQALG